MFSRPILAAAFAVTVLMLPAAASVPLINYRSVFDLVLAPGSDIAEAGTVTGRAVTEFSGSECAGYNTSVRFVTESRGKEGERQVDDVRGVSFEAEGVLEFENESYSDNKLTERSVGTAESGPEGAIVKLSEPTAKTFTVPGDVAFPTGQVQRIIDAAIAGKRFLAFDLYDGTGTGEIVYGTSAVIGAVSIDAGDLGSETGIADAGFAAMRHWPVTISYFKDPSRTDMTPAYSMSLVLYENGMSRDLKIDYGIFALIGKLTHLEVLPTPACPG